MEIYITTHNWEIKCNHWLLPSLEEIEKIREWLSKIENYIIENNIDIKDYNSKKLKKEYFNIQKRLKIKEEKDDNGFIYIIRSWNLYKVWKTKNILNRTKKYITENPYMLEVIHTYKITNMSEEEKRLHKLFENKRERWEWFNLSNEDILYIKTL